MPSFDTRLLIEGVINSNGAAFTAVITAVNRFPGYMLYQPSGVRVFQVKGSGIDIAYLPLTSAWHLTQVPL
jgi:hypothetical protein